MNEDMDHTNIATNVSAAQIVDLNTPSNNHTSDSTLPIESAPAQPTGALTAAGLNHVSNHVLISTPAATLTVSDISAPETTSLVESAMASAGAMVAETMAAGPTTAPNPAPAAAPAEDAPVQDHEPPIMKSFLGLPGLR